MASSPRPSRSRTWVDRGGTFTDVITWDGEGPPVARKVRSDQAIVGDLAEGHLVFGTTVATNALLERDGVRTLAVVTEGLQDLPHLRHMARPSLFDPASRWPDPLCDEVVGLPGRLDATGTEVEPLVPGPLAAVDLEGFEAVAVVLLHGPRNPDHEAQVAAWLRERAPHLHVSLGHRVSPEVGYLARLETTLVDAAITPVLRRAMVRDAIPGEAQAIRSDGGLVAAPALRAPDAVLSGPAGGVLAVEALARQCGFPGAIGLDMGGTSTDVCCVTAGERPRHQGDVLVAGVAVRRPMLEVETIAAGGGSILVDDGIALRVGPRSAGADPGPQCYGRGGPPTLTDAAVALGRVDPRAFDPPLDPAAIDLPGDPEEFVAVAQEAMAAAVRRIATARGLDVRDYALVSYGGAAGQHVAGVAERLGVGTVLVHPLAAVLSAWGQTLARPELSRVEAVWEPLEAVAPTLYDRARALLPDDPALDEHVLTVQLRPLGTEHALEVGLHADDDAGSLTARWARAHEAQHGFRRQDPRLEVVNLRARALGAAQAVPAPDPDPWGLGDTCRCGPVRLDCPTTSVWVPAGWTARIAGGVLRLDHVDAAPRPASTERTPFGVGLWGSRFMAVATEAGEMLRRLARSVNIRQRRDFSVAVFDGQGHLVANAPHIPVHLGAMGRTVRDLLRHHPDPEPGQSWLTNDPAAGGSHLPDLTVITPVVRGGERWFVASRAHHVDVGGLTPGSMPPTSRHLEDEGMVFRHVPLRGGDGGLRDLPELTAGSRQPEVVRADLEAQLAANALAARRLADLDTPEVITAWMAHLQAASEASVARVVDGLREGEARDVVDGVPLRVRLSTRSGRLTVDFTGTGGPHPGNLNAPEAVVRAAVLYVLRVLVAEDIPLNDGALAPVDLVLPRPSLVSPPAGAAVVGGNVETSQRLVDLLFHAAGARAAGQGTMNNLTLGGGGWSLYETLGGGQGGSPDGPGVDGLQVHMTNTRATDVEELEARLPLRLRRFARRTGSGGPGRHRGGDGVIRQLEVRESATAALLATRRDTGAPGLAGGGPGAPGADRIRRAGVWSPWDGRPVALDPGDRVEVRTPGGGGWGDPDTP